MSAYFFDSSALVKRYIAETGSVWVTQLTAPQSGNRIYVASITAVEVVAAITRKKKGNHVSAANAAAAIARFRHDLANDLRVFDLTPAVLASAMSLAEKHALRGYDAVQLAVALAIHHERIGLNLPSLTLIASDSALNAAAGSEGLPADDPNLH